MAPVWRLVRRREAGLGEPEMAAGSIAPAEGECDGCGTPLPHGRRRQPLRIEWPRGQPLKVADLTWPVGVHNPILSRSLAEQLQEHLGGLAPGPVELVGPRGPDSELVELWVTQELAPAAASTIVEHRPPCAVCGFTLTLWGDGPILRSLCEGRQGLASIEGVEWWESGGWDPERKALSRIRHPWREGAGLVFDHEPAGFFRLPGEQKFILCADEVKRALEGLTGVRFLRAG